MGPRVCLPVVGGALLVTTLVVAQDNGRNALRAALYMAADRWAVDRSLWNGLLREPSAPLRRLAVGVLAAAADPATVPLLERWGLDQDSAVRRETLVAAGRIGGPADRVALAGLESTSPVVRQAAAWAACHTGGAAAAALLARLGREPEVGVVETALGNLWRLEGTAWEGTATAIATNPEPRLRRALAYSLARRPRPQGRAALRLLARDPEPVIRATALRGLRDPGLTEADQALILDAVTDPDWRVQVEACRALEAAEGMTVPEATALAVRALWASPEPHLAVSAIRAAGPHPEIGSADDLEAVACSELEPWLAAEALAAIFRRGAPYAARFARWSSSDAKTEQRRAAAAAMRWLPERSAAPLEEKALVDRDVGVRLAWLEGLTGEQARGRLEILRRLVGSDPDPSVRSQALDLLRRAGAAGTVDELLERARAWGEDKPGDARATAYTTALAVAEGADRQRVVDRALADPDPAVVALVVNAARAEGLAVAAPVREPRHGSRWYADLAPWASEERCLDLVTVRGTVRVRLDPANAPISSREVWDLAEAGFYDGLTFHRVVPGFVVQGGDPRGDGWGGPGFVLPDEPSLEPFDAWRVGVASSGPNTGGCQLFFTLMPADHLTGHYTNLGEVVAGREVLPRIRVGDRILRVKTLTGPSPEPPPTLLGALQWSDLEALPGWREEKTSYQPDPRAVERLRQATGSYRVVAVLGTWCGDSAREVPRLQRVVEEVGSRVFELELYGVDRTKRVTATGFPRGLLPDSAAERVPTFVVLDQEGSELGRVVETAERPLEQLLLEMLSPAEGW